jgi:cysteinyl-tRNA synthetase
VGFVRVNEEKMSKSLGNFFTIREVLRNYPPAVGPEVVRYFLLSSHYRSLLNYTEEQLQQAKSTLTRLYQALRGLPEAAYTGQEQGYAERFYEAMDDDFNTPGALAVLAELAHEIFVHRPKDMERAAALGTELRHLGGILGVLQRDPDEFLRGGTASQGIKVSKAVVYTVVEELPRGGAAPLEEEQIEKLISQRSAARKRKDWAEADRIRKDLAAQGVVLEDLPDGTTTWRRE